MVTLTLPGADIRSYYQQLGIQLPMHARAEAPVRCFANPGSHRREDRDPSCSINVINGAWQCHGCGARGGAYDAAIAKGHTPRSAIDLMIAHGLIARRARVRTGRELPNTREHPPTVQAHGHARNRGPDETAARAELQVSQQDLARWQAALSRRPRLLARLADERGWRYQPMRELELGIDRGRITIPIRNAHGELRGVLRYQPEHTDRPKMLAVRGTRLGLVPHPDTDRSSRVFLVEGPPDMIAARSRGLPAFAVPGDHAWQPQWGRLLAGRQVAIVMDADTQGRAAARCLAYDLIDQARVEILELAPNRTDGYDLTDWLLEHPQLTTPTLALLGYRLGTNAPPNRRSNDGN